MLPVLHSGVLVTEAHSAPLWSTDLSFSASPLTPAVTGAALIGMAPAWGGPAMLAGHHTSGFELTELVFKHLDHPRLPASVREDNLNGVRSDHFKVRVPIRPPSCPCMIPH